MRIDDVAVDAVEVVLRRQRGQIVLERVLHEAAFEPDLVLAAALMDVVAERFHHEVQDLFVLAEHDVRAGSVERESVFDDRSAQATDVVAPLDNFYVIAEERGECDAGNAAAEDADGTMDHEGGVL